MKSVGIIGGIGPESTVEYYRSIIAFYREQTNDGSYPSIIINSIDVKKLLNMAAANQLDAMTDYLVVEIDRLAKAGADFAVLAANTPHIVFGEVSLRSRIPLISIVEATREAVINLAISRVGLFGTRFTMQGRFYPDIFSKKSISLIVPTEPEQNYIHDKYTNELIPGIVLPETRLGLLSIIRRMRMHENIQAVILAEPSCP